MILIVKNRHVAKKSSSRLDIKASTGFFKKYSTRHQMGGIVPPYTASN